MNQHQLVVSQSSVADVCPSEGTAWQNAQNHNRVARLTMVLTWPKPRAATRRREGEIEARLVSLVAAIGSLLAFAAVLLGTSYLSGTLIKRIESLPRYNQTQVQYSDVWKWQGHR